MAVQAAKPDAAVLVALDFGAVDIDATIAEARELIATAGAAVKAIVRGRREKPDAALFAGKGKVEEIADAVAESGAKWVVFNHALSPIQIRNLERELHTRVLDRTDLILDIFAQRARSHEGKLQVDLARLEHHMTRLVRGWTHLERQRGGIGVRGGPGETQLEIDRRLVADRIRLTKERIAKVVRQRNTQRGSRRRSGVQSVAIVGYTNAGKSTLFNRLTRADTYVADQLFATLDTTSRRAYVGDGVEVILSDTVGFIRDLPHALVAAFRATLEETANADLLLHVVDASSPRRDGEIEDVNAVLAEIGAETVPQLLVFNKMDLLPAADSSVAVDQCGKINELRISAATGQGLEALRAAVLSRLPAQPSRHPNGAHVPEYNSGAIS
ncbi:MAG: GTPase HflX [Burkholderiales bacterium]|nr:GTPase HflX [Burkholderiales bacterium]